MIGRVPSPTVQRATKAHHALCVRLFDLSLRSSILMTYRLTAIGVADEGSTFGSTPSWPQPFPPQQLTVPLLCRTQAKSDPIATCAASLIPATGVGAGCESPIMCP